jgi:hypothetical protein
MHEDGGAILREDDIGLSREIPPLQPEAEASCVKRLAHG